MTNEQLTEAIWANDQANELLTRAVKLHGADVDTRTTATTALMDVIKIGVSLKAAQARRKAGMK